jgi:hypothetical protein
MVGVCDRVLSLLPTKIDILTHLGVYDVSDPRIRIINKIRYEKTNRITMFLKLRKEILVLTNFKSSELNFDFAIVFKKVVTSVEVILDCYVKLIRFVRAL